MPSRKSWISPRKHERYLDGTNQRINSVEFNVKSILRTIKYYQRVDPQKPFLIKLDQFINNILEEINNPFYVIYNPKILAKLKDPLKKADKTCRPICIYNLKDKIIISLVNKYFTNIFNTFFYEHSYAFKAKSTKDKFPPTHHNAIDYLLAYKANYKGKRLWVSECDISKFFDTVSHKIVRTEFLKLVRLSDKKNSFSVDDRAIAIFFKYLKSFDFQKHIFKKNGDLGYWNEQRISEGKFGWVKNSLLDSGFYRDISKNRIGIPQGGALSGLIANIVLHYADTKILSEKDDKLLYVRFCDDMIIIHPNKAKAREYTSIYNNSLRDLKLISHKPEIINYNNKSNFWNNSKSKSPYKWSNSTINSMNRIGFVGYEIGYDGSLRVRKTSLIKEKLKIKKLISNTIYNLRKGKRKTDNMIIESVSNKLVGMSVGRVTMKNYRNIDNDMCWANGFRRLGSNSNLKLQLRRLDRIRSKYISKFRKRIKKIPFIDNGSGNKSRYIGKHFFCKIYGVNNSDSVIIREELMQQNILSTKFYLTSYRREKIQDGVLPIILSATYAHLDEEVIKLLATTEPENRDPPIYGKPFSYYFNVVEKK